MGAFFRGSVLAAAACASLAAPSAAHAQDRPFIFSVTTAADVSKPRVRIDYDVGVGEQTFRSQQTNGPEHRVGVHASIGRWTLLGRVGLSAAGTDRADYDRSQQGEVLYAIVAPRADRVQVAAGGGLTHEAGGANVLTGRVVAGRDTRAWRAHGNVAFEKPLAEGRDAVDVITSAGWARRLSDAFAVGIEAIGEDLEGFWEREEAEGGARLLVGPSFHLAPPNRAWQVTLAGGPMFHPATSARTSGALRDLPAQTATRGYAVKLAFSASF